MNNVRQFERLKVDMCVAYLLSSLETGYNTKSNMNNMNKKAWFDCFCK